jgi:hypothetical protein
LLGRGVLDKLGRIKPPGGARAVSNNRFSPKLIAIANQFVNQNTLTPNWPETPAARFVAQVVRMIYRASEDALSGTLDQIAAIRRPETIDRSANKGLDFTDLGATQ